jgi:eukaryotic-like serine/threonine-protein kinase
MAHVYRARDARLNRDVAIKVSGEQFSERFEREAKAIAALNHPNICQIYDVDPDFLVMEYIDGRPIVDCEQPQALPLDEALDSRSKLLPRSRPHTARGSLIATSNQRTPRDLGRGCKAAGFRTRETESRQPDQQRNPERRHYAGGHNQGIIMDTPTYIWPEQAEGKLADARTSSPGEMTRPSIGCRPSVSRNPTSMSPTRTCTGSVRLCSPSARR